MKQSSLAKSRRPGSKIRTQGGYGSAEVCCIAIMQSVRLEGIYTEEVRQQENKWSLGLIQGASVQEQQVAATPCLTQRLAYGVRPSNIECYILTHSPLNMLSLAGCLARLVDAPQSKVLS